MVSLENYIRKRVNIDDSSLHHILSQFEAKTLKKHELLVSDGKICKEMAFVEKGLFRIFHITSEGKEATACFYNQGQFAFDAVSFLNQIPSIEFVEAMEDAVVYTISHSRLQALYNQHPILERFFRLVIEEQFSEFKNLVLSQLRESAEDRYFKILHNRPYLLEKVPLKYIASYLGINEPSLSRIRRQILVKA